MPETQIFRVGVSPRQRFELTQVFNTPERFLHGETDQEAYVLFNDALHLNVIHETADRHAGQVPPFNVNHANNTTPAAFVLTKGNVDFLLDVALRRIPISGMTYRILSPVITSMKAQRKGAPSDAILVPNFDAETDALDWAFGLNHPDQKLP